MDDELTRAERAARVSALTSERVERMAEAARTDLARELAERPKTGPGASRRRVAPLPFTPTRRASVGAETAAAARVAAELRRTERRLDRLERSMSHGRFQTGGGGA